MPEPKGKIDIQFQKNLGGTDVDPDEIQNDFLGPAANTGLSMNQSTLSAMASGTHGNLEHYNIAPSAK